MSSLEMLAYINSTRKVGSVEIRHDHLMAKVLGKDAPKFLGTSSYTGNGTAQLTRSIYNFPKRESMLMAMSYSYELQAQIFDAWEATEAALSKAVKPAVALIPNFDDPIAAARHLLYSLLLVEKKCIITF